MCSQTQSFSPDTTPPGLLCAGSRRQVTGKLWEAGLLIDVPLSWPSASQALAELSEDVLRDLGVVPNLPSLLLRTPGETALAALPSLSVSLKLSLFPPEPSKDKKPGKFRLSGEAESQWLL